MTSKKNKAKTAKSPPSSTKSSTQIPAPAPGAPEPLPLPEDTPPPPEDTPPPPELPEIPELNSPELPELPELEDTTPTEILLGHLFDAWIGHLLGPCFHWMTRTWGHHRVGDAYDTSKIFEQLEILGGGDHGKLLAEFTSFRVTLFKDLGDWLADRRENA